MHPEFTEKDIARFWSKVEKTNDCWLWIGPRARGNYGTFSFGRRVNQRHVPAHRVAFMLSIGPIPDGLFVCHHCDVRHCVRPDHLFLGTHQDNMDDAKAKGRFPRGDQSPSRLHPECLARGERHGSRTHPERLPRGENHHWNLRPENRLVGDKNPFRLHPERHPKGEQVGTAKLTADQVRSIREQYAQGGVRYVDLARQFGVHFSLIGLIVQRKAWKHLSD